MHRFVTHRRDVIKSNSMLDSPFTNPLDWYNANKQHFPAGFKAFENPQLENLTSQQEGIEKAH